MTEKYKLKWNKPDTYNRFLFIFVALLGLFMGVIAFVARPADALYEDKDVRLIQEWVYQSADGPVLCTYQNFKEVTNGAIGNFIVSTTLPDSLTDRDTLSLRIVSQNIHVYINNEEVSSYGYHNEPLWHSPGNQYMFIPLSPDYSGLELKYEINTVYESDFGIIPESYIGSKSALLGQYHSYFDFRYYTAIIFWIIGFILIISYMILRMNKSKNEALLSLGIFVCLICTWLMMEGKMFQFVIGKPYFMYALTFLPLLAAAIPFLTYIDFMQDRRYHEIFSWSEFVLSVIAISVELLQLFRVYDFVDTLFLSHINLIIAMICSVVTTVLCFYKYKDKRVRPLLVGFFGLMPFGIIEIVMMYNNSNYKRTGSFICLGIAFFMLTQVYGILKTILKMENDKLSAEKDNRDKSIFLANMSHEIRTPMNAILAMSDLLSKSSELNERDLEYANMIYSSSKNLLQIINDILDYSKFSSGKYDILHEVYDPYKTVNEIKEIMELKAKDKNLEFNVALDQRIPKLLVGDEGRIRQILLNLLNNAIKYTEEGSVDLKVGYRPIDQDYSELIFIVTDTGIGIKPEDQKNLFNEFSQVDTRKNRLKEGTGLGLAITKNLCELMDGRIVVNSDYGKGSTFAAFVKQQISIPEELKIHEESEGKSLLSDHMFYAPKFRVLVVDDNRVNLKVIYELLKRYQIEPDLAESGFVAIDKLKSGIQYDLIFMDYMMPEMDGREATTQIRQLNGCGIHELPIIALTADVLHDTKDVLLSSGMNDFLGKPVKIDELHQMISKYVPQHLKSYDSI